MGNVLWALVLLMCLSLPATATAQRDGAQASLPDGEGKDVVEVSCTACHGLRQIVGSAGYDADGWRDLIRTMVALPDGRSRTGRWLPGCSFPAEIGPCANLGSR